jgi:hypothetical protein
MPYGKKFSTRPEKVVWLIMNQLETCRRLLRMHRLRNVGRQHEYMKALHFKMVQADLVSPKTYWMDLNWIKLCELAVGERAS